jgi:hypothetical protein
VIREQSFKILNIEFTTSYEHLEDIFLYVYKAPTLEKLIYPLEVPDYLPIQKSDGSFTQIKTPNEFCLKRLLEDHDFSYNFRRLTENHPPFIHKFDNETSSFFANRCYFFTGTLDPLIFIPYGLTHDICLPLNDLKNITYYFNVIMSEERAPYVSLESVIALVLEQVELVNPFFMECNLIDCSVSKEGRYFKTKSPADNFYKNKYQKITLPSGDSLSPFIGGINYFSFELWERLGEKRQKAISIFCNLDQVGEGIISSLKASILAGYPHDAAILNEVNKTSGLGTLSDRTETCLNLSPFNYFKCFCPHLNRMF